MDIQSHAKAKWTLAALERRMRRGNVSDLYPEVDVHMLKKIKKIRYGSVIHKYIGLPVDNDFWIHIL